MSKTTKTPSCPIDSKNTSSNQIRNSCYSLLKEIGIYITIDKNMNNIKENKIIIDDSNRVVLKSEIAEKQKLKMVNSEVFYYNKDINPLLYCLVVKSISDISKNEIPLSITFNLEDYFKIYTKLSLFCVLFLDSEINIIENSINNECVKLLIQYSDSRWDQLYKNIFSNILYNLTEYRYALKNIKKIKSNPNSEMNLIMNNGPLELNKDIETFSNLIQDEEELKKPHDIDLAGGATSSHVVCPKCKSNRVHINIVQDRSGDEGASYYFTCRSDTCGYTWRKRG